jgi:hypothetical protein
MTIKAGSGSTPKCPWMRNTVLKCMKSVVVQRVGEVQEEVKSHANALLVDLEQMRKHDGYDQEWTFNTPIK